MRKSIVLRVERGLRRKLTDAERADFVRFVVGATRAIAELRSLPAVDSEALEEVTESLGELSFGLSVLRSNLPDGPLKDGHIYRKLNMPEDLRGLGEWLSDHLYTLVYRAQYARKDPGKGLPRDVKMACEVYARLRAPLKMPHVLGCYFNPQAAVALPRATAIEVAVMVAAAGGACVTKSAVEQATRAGRSLKVARLMTLTFGRSSDPVGIAWGAD